MEKKLSGTEHLNGSKKARRRQSKTFKSLTLATLLIILPFGLYWYLQIDQHRQYQQEKIYRTLHELDLHINNEINALTKIKNVLPKKEQLTSVLELTHQEYSRIDNCGYRLLEKTYISGMLGLSNDESTQCDVSEDFLSQARSFLQTELDSDNRTLENAQTIFVSQVKDGKEYIKETRGLMLELIKSYQKNINALCKDKDLVKIKGSYPVCIDIDNLNKTASIIELAEDMDAIFYPSLSIYLQCYEQHGSRYTRKIIKDFHLACNDFMAGYEYIIDDMKEFSTIKDSFEKEPKKTVTSVVNAFNQMLEAMTQIEEIIDYKIDKKLLDDRPVIQIESRERERLVTRNTFNKNLLEPYQKLVSRSHVCMYISTKQNKMEEELVLVSASQFKKMFSENWQDCKSILQGDSLLLHRTSWLGTDKAANENKENLWLAVGFDTVMRRYREQLRYMQDIYLVSGEGNILSSFVDANKDSLDQEVEQPIINLQPIFISLDRLSDAEKNNDVSETSRDDDTLKVTNADIKVAIGDNKKNNDVIAWPFQASLEIEAKDYLAMVKPMATMLMQPAGISSETQLSDTTLMLVGLKESDSLSIFTARLSPLFHLTVLLIVLFLILVMPIFHILMAKVRNSYTLRTIRLYGITIVLTVIVGAIGFAGYYSMLKQNIFITQQIIETSSRLLKDWQKERDASINFLKKSEACLFSKYYNLTNTSQSFSDNCYPEFRELKEYKNYKPMLHSDPYTMPDTFIYKVKNALPMMGLLFFTDRDAIKQQPDWMAREFIPLKKDNIDLSQRKYFQSISEFDGWHATSISTPYFIERIYNYIDGRKVTQLSIPKNHTAYESEATFTGILSGEILALSLEQPILPPGMRFAVVETDTGKVMFHSERERVLVENFYKEVDSSKSFEDSVRAGSDTMEMIVYRSEKLLAYSTRVPDTNWSLILTFDSSPIHSMVNEVAVGTFIVILLMLLIVSITAILFGRFIKLMMSNNSNNKYESINKVGIFEKLFLRFDNYMLPLRVKDFYWLILTICSFFVLGAMFLMQLPFLGALIWCFVYMIALLFVTRKSKVSTKENISNTGQWIRLNPAALCYFLIFWMGLPTLFIFARWYDLSSHQLESHNYLKIKNNMAERGEFIDKHRKTLWYGDKSEPKNHWLDKHQESLGVMVNFKLHNNQRVLNFKDMNQSVLESSVGLETLSSNDNINKLYVVNEPDSQVIDYAHLSYCINLFGSKGKGDRELWRSIPLLSNLSKISYSVEGQSCNQVNYSDVNISILEGSFSDVLQLEFTDSFISNNSLSRVNRLNLSLTMINLLITVFLIGLYIYCRILIKGIWHSYWLTGEPLVIKDSSIYSMPIHRMYIKPCESFVRNLIAQATDEISIESNKLYLLIRDNSIESDTNLENIYLYPSIDLISMDIDKRLLLLTELETRINRTDSIIWITVDIPPLYRLLKQRAYPGKRDSMELTSHEILRWSNIFKRFYKDYHTGFSDNVEKLLVDPIPKKYTDSNDSKSSEWLDQETIAFKPELLWIKDIVLREHNCSLNFDNVQRLTAMYAGAFYRYKWEECTSDERLLLYQVASGRYPCPKNNEVIEHLLRRGYLIANPLLKICNASFCEFILNAELQEVFDEWHDEAEQSGWQQVRIYVGVLILLILAWLAYTSKDTYQQLAYVIGSLLTVFTALTQGANLLKLGKGSNE